MTPKTHGDKAPTAQGCIKAGTGNMLLRALDTISSPFYFHDIYRRSVRKVANFFRYSDFEFYFVEVASTSNDCIEFESLVTTMSCFPAASKARPDGSCCESAKA